MLKLRQSKDATEPIGGGAHGSFRTAPCVRGSIALSRYARLAALCSILVCREDAVCRGERSVSFR